MPSQFGQIHDFKLSDLERIKIIFWYILHRQRLYWEVPACWGQWLRHSRSWVWRRDSLGGPQWAFNAWVNERSRRGKKTHETERLEIRIQLRRRHSKLLEVAIYLAGVIRTHICWLSSDVLGTVLDLWLGSVLSILSFKEKCSVGIRVVNNTSWDTWKFRWSKVPSLMKE